MYVPLRTAGATARMMLVTAAAQRWQVDPAACRAEKGAVIHAASHRRLGYGELADAAAKLPVPKDVALKTPGEFKLIGTPHRRLDTSGKVNGAAKYGIDTRLAGMKFAVLAQSPAFGGRLISVDEAAALSVTGVSQVVRLDDAVAVVATNTHFAKLGLAAANPQWDPGPNGKLDSAQVEAGLSAASVTPGAVARHDGDAAATIASSARKVEAVYQQPFLAHAAMEPMNCTVHFTADGCDLWLGTQVPGLTQSAVCRLTGLKPEQVHLHNHLLGGGFGRRLEFDGTVRAVQIARHVPGPVQVIWTREEDIQHDMYRPAYHDRIAAALDARGKPIAWSHRVTGSSIVARYFPGPLKGGVDFDAVETSENQPYEVGSIHVDYVKHDPPPGMFTSWWRGVGATRGTFVVESFVDELAAEAKEDPLAYRLTLLEKNPRARDVLQIAAERAEWGKALPARHGRGIALGIGFGTFLAQVVEVAVDKDGTVSVPRVWCVVDCGIQVNPDTIRAQMESGIIFGLSAALQGEITLKEGRVEQTNFGDYPVLRMNEIPRIDVALVKSGEAPGGIGEPATCVAMPALTNAIFAATGRRIRKLPVADQAKGAA
jgi:isoquinoline 1-oxidoreductase beta subunit